MNRFLMTLVVFFSLLLAACSGGEPSDAGAADTVTTPSETTAAETAAPETTAPEATFPDPDETATTSPLPPEHDSGTVTWRGETVEITDFGLCETVNPAFEGDFNIQFDLPDGTEVGMMGNIDDFSADYQGLILGSLPDEERATDLQLTLDGRVLSGSANTTEGAIEFSFEC